MSADGVSFSPAIGELQTWNDADGFLFLEVPLAYHVDSPIQAVSIQVDLLTDLMPAHKNLAQISFGGGSQEFVFEGGATYRATATAGGFWQTAKSFLVLGIEHIFPGYDHIMFLFGLLLVGRDFGNLTRTQYRLTVTRIASAIILTFGLAWFYQRIV